VVPTTAGAAGLAPWLRAFSDSGEVDPNRSANFGAGGDFGFHQSNHGWELGLETRPSARLAIGALLGTSDGSQSISGTGSDRFDGRSFGLYATWLAGNGFYLDVSHRWTGVDARLRSGEGTYETQASAQSFNVEAGMRAWSVGDFNVVPQLQYTHTRIADIDALSNGQAEFVNDGGVSSRARLGVAFDRTFLRGGLALTPYGSISAVHEFDGEYTQSINGGLLGASSVDGTSAMAELGLGAQSGGWSLTGGVNWSDGGALEGVGGGQVVVRYIW
jgi:outer membrane autotransporter protein